MKQHLLTRIYERLRPRMVADAARYSATPDDALDILQEAFIRLWQRRESITDADRAEGLMAVTARNMLIDNARRRMRHPTVDIVATPAGDSPADDGSPADDPRLSQVIEIIDHTLSPRARQVLYMRDRLAMDFDEIADELDLSPQNVRLILSRARRKVRDTFNSNNTRS